MSGPGRIVVREVELCPQGGAQARYRARLYAPEGRTSAELPGIYLQHGMTVTGISDPRVDTFARNLAAGGCAVVLPELESITRLALEPGSIDEIEALFLALTQRGDLVDAARCGFVGAGVSAGFGLAALSRPAARGKAKAYLGIGAYGRFYETALAAVAELDLDPYGAFLILANFILRARPDAAALQRVLQACAARVFLGQPLLTPDEAPELSPSEREAFTALVEDRAYRQDLVRDLLGALSAAELDGLSPLRQRVDPGCPVVLLHGRDDPSVPPEESRLLANQIREAGGDVTRVVTRAITHGDAEPLWKVLPSVPALAVAFGRFIHALGA
jgi:acetyl esterase/lipase